MSEHKPGASRTGSAGAVFRTTISGLILAGCAVLLFASQPSIYTAKDSDAGKAPPAGGQVERGKYLVTIMGCNDCHTPFKMGPNGPEPDMSKMLSGQPQGMAVPPIKLDMPWMWAGNATNTAFAGPWGITFAPNLTSDEETGIGAWDEDLFVTVFRSGKWMGAGRPIMPPMPIQAYSHATDEDLKAIFAYLKTVPPIKNEVPDYLPPAGQGMEEKGMPHGGK